MHTTYTQDSKISLNKFKRTKSTQCISQSKIKYQNRYQKYLWYLDIWKLSHVLLNNPQNTEFKKKKPTNVTELLAPTCT